MSKKIYRKFSNGNLVQLARIVLFSNGRYGFETNQFGEWEKNVNMPMFSTEEEAARWIENNPKWQYHAERK